MLCSSLSCLQLLGYQSWQLRSGSPSSQTPVSAIFHAAGNGCCAGGWSGFDKVERVLTPPFLVIYRSYRACSFLALLKQSRQRMCPCRRMTGSQPYRCVACLVRVCPFKNLCAYCVGVGKYLCCVSSDYSGSAQGAKRSYEHRPKFSAGGPKGPPPTPPPSNTTPPAPYYKKGTTQLFKFHIHVHTYCALKCMGAEL